MAERILTCVYCGHAYPQETPAWGHEVLTEHIARCVAHPMRKALEERKALRDALAGLVGVDGKEELLQLQSAIQYISGPDDADRQAMLAAIGALISTLDDGATEAAKVGR